MTTTQQILTADDLWRMPDDGMRHELIRGELTVMSPAGSEHGRISMRSAFLLEAHAREGKLGEVLVSKPGFLIARDPDTVRAPDVAFVSKKRIPPAGLPKAYALFAPDIAVEVLSPSDAQEDVEEKIGQWLQAGAGLVWVVNPRGRTVTVHRRGRDPRILREGNVLDGEDVCQGFSVRVGELF